MTIDNAALREALLGAFGPEALVLEPERRARLSRDFHWYSPILARELSDRTAEIVALPRSETDIVTLMEIAETFGTPVTVRGAGTGNYGQCVPLRGGIVVDMTMMNQLLELRDDAVRAEAGARMGDLERAASQNGRELRVMPSTYEKSTLGGFVAGGAGGIGSSLYGWLWDGQVSAARIVTSNPAERMVNLTGAELLGALHAYGTTGILTELTFALAERRPWLQLALAFPDFLSAARFGHELARSGLRSRLISVSEPGLIRFFRTALPWLDGSKAAAFIYVEADAADPALEMARTYGGELSARQPAGRHPMLSDFSWNHVTLWAKKADDAWTYLQTGFDRDHFEQQIAMVKQRFGDEALLHFEYVRSRGEVHLAGLTTVYYRDAEALRNTADFMESIGIELTNPHTYILEDGGRRHGAWESWGAIYAAKTRFDPANLLNPGKLRGVVASASV